MSSSTTLNTYLEESQRTFLHAPDVMEFPSLDPHGIAGAKKRIDFDAYEDEVRSLEDSIRVYARIKPPQAGEEEYPPRLRQTSDREIMSRCDASSGGLSQRFLFTRIFDASVGQRDFFREMVDPRIREFLQGTHQLLFTYGTSSSGKTFTVQGSPAQPGILPRALDIIFNSLQHQKCIEKSPLQPVGFDAVTSCPSSNALKEEKDAVLALGSYLLQEVGEDTQNSCTSSNSSAIGFSTLSQRLREETRIEGMDSEGMYYSIWVSFAEIYNENIYDLFEKVSSLPKKLRGAASRKTPLKLCEERKGSAYIKGLKEICVASADEAYQLLLIGRKNLQFAATKLNHNSSRSHCIFTIKLVRFCDLKNPQMGRVHILSFCDLAGSERLKKTNTVGTRRMEAGNINASLLVLSRVMKTLRDNQRLKDPKKQAVVPFRDSKLTRLFQAFFMGYGRASMIVNITLSPYLFDETLQALKFAAITSKINYAKEVPPSKPKRKSRFSSILFQHKRTSALTGRNTILWENPEARSTLCPSREDEESEESDEEEEANDTQYEALTNLISDLERRLLEEKRKNTTLESDIRTELCKEFNVMMVKVESEWQQRLKDTTERMDELNDWRIQKLESAYNVSRKRKRHELNSDDELKDKVIELESKLEERDLELEDNNKQLKAIKDTHKSLLDARNKLQEELTSLRFTSEDQKSKIQYLENEMEKLSLESKSKDSAIESLSSNPIIKDLKNQLWELKTKLSDKTEEVTYFKKLLDEAGEEFLAKDDNEAKLNAEILSLKTELANTKMALSDASEENSVLMKDNTSRQEGLESLEELLANCRSENMQLQEDNKRLQCELSKYQSSSSEEAEDQEKITNLRKRLNSTSEEVESLLGELNKVRKCNEEQEKVIKKMEEDKSRLEKDLNDEIETLRRSKIKLKSTEEGKSKKLQEKDLEIKNLEKEVKNLLKDFRESQEALNKKTVELEEFRRRLKEEVEDTQVLGKKIAEQQSLIQTLEAQVKSSQKEEDVIVILRNELKLKNTERAQLMEKISELEESAGRLSQLSKTQETVAFLESEIEAKNYEIKRTKEEKDSVLVRYNKLIKSKEEELSREKQEAIKLRDVMRTATPSKKFSKSQLEEEILKKDEIIKELENRLQKSLCDGEVEDVLRDEIESLKRSISESQELHKKELSKIRKANEKVINEYKEANMELQKQVGISSSSTEAPPSSGGRLPPPDSPPPQEEEELIDSSAVSMEAQSVKRRPRKTRARKLVSSPMDESNLENEVLGGDEDSENSSVRKSTRVTRSRPVHKTKKKHVSYIERNAKGDKRSSDAGDTSRDVHECSIETPRKSKRNPPSGQVDALSPLENLDGSWEASRSAGKRQLRTRRKKY